MYHQRHLLQQFRIPKETYQLIGRIAAWNLQFIWTAWALGGTGQPVEQQNAPGNEARIYV
jgi:hypothetical protein